jgi:hypothetical protein
VFPKRGTHTTDGMQGDFKGYTTENKLLKPVWWLALNKETKSSYLHETASPSSAHSLFSVRT